MTPITLQQIAQHLPILLKSKLVPYLRGSPAIGKSSVAHQVAKQLGLKVIDIRLAECDPTDLQGFPYFDQETKKASYYPLNTFPTENDDLPQGYNGWLVFLDEFSNAPLAVQAAAYKLVLDRQVGQHKLHKNVAIIAAGNREDDNAAAQPMSSALVSRFSIFEIEVNQKEWNEWAAGAGIDYRITSYMNFRPDHLYTFKPSTSEQPYASPRTWAMLSNVMQHISLTTSELPILASLIGEGVASEFLGYLKLQDELPSFETIIANPKTAPLGKDLSILWATMGMVCYKVSEKTLATIIEYIQRFSDDLQIVAMREISQRHPELRTHAAFNTWANELCKVFK